MSDLISDDYRKQLQELHTKDRNWGNGPAQSIYEVCDFIKKYHIFYNTMLDYGCGKGALVRLLMPTVKMSGYDPGMPEYSAMPKMHNFTVCCDVLEHIEEDKLPGVLSHIAEVTNHQVFFNIDVTPSKTILPDGRNAHINLKTREEWINVLSKYFQMETASRGICTIRYIGTSLVNMERRKKAREAAQAKDPHKTWR